MGMVVGYSHEMSANHIELEMSTSIYYSTFLVRIHYLISLGSNEDFGGIRKNFIRAHIV